MKINEIFYSLQGEGFWTGTPCVFVRFSGCNLSCPFCDTQHKTGQTYTNDELFNEIKKYPSKHIVFTGGEPSLQLSSTLCLMLKQEGYYIQVETNGTKALPSSVDWITCSPKTDYCNNAKVCHAHVNELKVVFNNENTYRLQEYLIQIDADNYYLQPCDVGDVELNNKILSSCVDYILKNPKWKLSLQTHKIINVR